MNKRNSFTATCVAGLLVSAGHADILSGDSEFGADTVTIDTDLQLEFLDLTITDGLSYNEVLADSAFDSWRHATFAEVREMWLNAGLEDWSGTSYSGPGSSNGPGVSAEVAALVDLVGGTVLRATFGPTQYFSAVGIVADEGSSSDLHRATELYSHPLATEYGLPFLFNADTPSDAAGHWLVRQVPAPGACGVLAMASVVLSRRSRRTASI